MELQFEGAYWQINEHKLLFNGQFISPFNAFLMENALQIKEVFNTKTSLLLKIELINFEHIIWIQFDKITGEILAVKLT